MHDAAPKRQGAIEFKYAAATGRAGAEGVKSGADRPFVCLCVSIHEEKHLALSRACSGIARRGDVAMLDANDTRSHLFRKLRSRIG
jgi:hypothetical protein